MKAFLSGIYKGPNKNMSPDLLSVLLLTGKGKKTKNKKKQAISFSGKLPCNARR